MKRSYSLIISIFLPFLIAGITYFSIHSNINLYTTLLLPKNLVMSSYIYVFFWSIQYLILGYASHLVYQTDAPDSRKVLLLYSLQLLLLLIWPIVLFNIQDYLLATIIILFSWGLSMIMIYTFYKIHKIAGYLLIPYFVWVSYMLYYHFQIFMLN